MNNNLRKIFSFYRDNKFATLLVLSAAGLLLYGQITGTRLIGGASTEDWRPSGPNNGGHGGTHRFYHK